MKYFSIILILAVSLFSCQSKESNHQAESKAAALLFDIETVAVQSDASFRGLHVYNDSIVWLSGSKATFARTLDAGATWLTDSVPGAGKMQFRDVQVLSPTTALLLSAGLPARVYKTEDAGVTWNIQYENLSEGVFFDAMDFWDDSVGIAFSDPVDHKLLVIKTEDAGTSWYPVDTVAMPVALDGEAGFAASGTCLRVGENGRAWVGLGGPSGARIYASKDYGTTWQAHLTPILSGTPSQGIFSIDYYQNQLIIAGGDYAQDSVKTKVMALSKDGGITWSSPEEGPHGFRSAVRYAPGIEQDVLFACGTSGIDISKDGGKHWRNLSNQSTNALDVYKDQIWLVGDGGKVIRLKRVTPQ